MVRGQNYQTRSLRYKTAGTQPGCFTICDLVAEIREVLKDEPDAAARFDYLLMEGMYIDHAEYHQHYFCLQGIRFFNVTERFPRLKRTDVPVGIRNAKYELELSSLIEFETDDYMGV